jgi:hypothetical protein
MKNYLKKNLSQALLIFVMSLAVSTIAYAQFVAPGAAPTAGNAAAPLNLGAGLQQKFGNFWAGVFTSTNGLAFQTQTATTTWASQSGLNTLSIEQFCVGANCISSLKVPNTPTDIYVTLTSCSGGPCSGDPYTAAGICQASGLPHLVSAIFGGSSNNNITRVTCDTNGTSPTSSAQITIANANGSTNIFTANTPKSGGGDTGGSGCQTGAHCVNQ